MYQHTFQIVLQCKKNLSRDLAVKPENNIVSVAVTDVQLAAKIFNAEIVCFCIIVVHMRRKFGIRCCKVSYGLFVPVVWKQLFESYCHSRKGLEICIDDAFELAVSLVISDFLLVIWNYLAYV